MTRYFKASFWTGYVGTDLYLGFVANDEKEVEDYCEEYLIDYIQDWESLISYSGEDFYESREYADYVDGCGYNIEEMESADFSRSYTGLIDLR